MLNKGFPAEDRQIFLDFIVLWISWDYAKAAIYLSVSFLCPVNYFYTLGVGRVFGGRRGEPKDYASTSEKIRASPLTK